MTEPTLTPADQHQDSQPRAGTAEPQPRLAQSDQREQQGQTATRDVAGVRPLPHAIVNVWIVRSIIGCTIGGLIVVAVVIAGILAGLPGPPAWVIAVVAIVLWALLVAICVLIAKYRYRFTSYRIDRNVFSVQTGFIFRTLTVVPYTRVQHVETEQGPILRHFGLVKVAVSTAVDSHVIAGLEPELARKTLDQLAELVRLAKEDL